jgi:uncharacterized protein YceK
MAVRAIRVALLLSTLAGCGTVANLAQQGPEGGMTPFGGVGHDVRWVREAKEGECNLAFHPEPGPGQYPQVALMLLCAADLPFSFIGDVLTWPYVAAYVCVNEPVSLPPVTEAPPPPASPWAVVQPGPALPLRQAPAGPVQQAPAGGSPLTHP